MTYTSYEQLWHNGRLGNQLWQIASTVGIAKESGSTPIFPTWEYQPYFKVPAALFTDALPSDRTDLGTAYLQELQFIAGVEDEVRDWFRPTPEASEKIFANSMSILTAEHTTAVHVRRGDYLLNPNHFPLPTIDYYADAGELVREEYPDTTFIVFSDDIEWCRDADLTDVLGGETVYSVKNAARPVETNERVGAPQDQFDLFLMTLCNRHIISNSTFSWWGAYLSDDAHVIYPSVWFGSALDFQECPAPQGWEAMDSC